MTKYIGAGLLLVVLIAVAGYMLRQEPASGAETEDVSSGGSPMLGSLSNDMGSYDHLVRFDGDVFEPKELTIRVGERVRFLNESDTGVWPASAVHPTHSVYPDKDPSNCLGSSFDSCRALEKDEFFDFTFEHEGEWRYHDHVRAFKTGVVIVRP